jgi:toxin-antitoxin system PIN domain toxin
VNLLDTNLWIALALSKHHLHTTVRDWFAAQPARQPMLFCRSTHHSFLRLLTTEKVMGLYGLPPLTNAAAWDLAQAFLANPRITIAAEPPALEAQWKKLAARHTPSPKLWMDAYLAAFALTGHYTLITTDKAFTQFKDLHPTILS